MDRVLRLARLQVSDRIERWLGSVKRFRAWPVLTAFSAYPGAVWQVSDSMPGEQQYFPAYPECSLRCDSKPELLFWCQWFLHI